MSFYNEDKRPWRSLTDEEKGALLLAWYEGKVIECYQWPDYGWRVLIVRDDPNFDEDSIYRVKPEPKRPKVTLHWAAGNAATDVYTPRFDTHRIIFDVIDGEPDCGSIRMEKLS